MRSRFKIPLSVALTVPYVLLIVLSVGLAGFLSFRYNQTAIEQLSRDLRARLLQDMDGHLGTILRTPHELTQTNAALIYAELVDPSDTPRMQRLFLEQVISHPTVTSLYFGSREGGVVGAGRESADGSLYVYQTDERTASAFSKFTSDPSGNYTRLALSLPDFDSRLRPWYQKAVSKGYAAWSDIYVVFTGQDLAVAASRPVYSADHQFIGVVSVDVFLSQMQQYLHSLEITPNGESYLIERDGSLVASSSGVPLLQDLDGDGKNDRVSILATSDPLGHAAGAFLQSNFSDLNSITGQQHLRFTSAGKPYYLSVQPLRDPYGVDWLILVVIPESDYMGSLQASRITTLLAILTALLAAVGISLLFSRVFVRHFTNLSGSIQKLAGGEWRDEAVLGSALVEIDQLIGAFNKMGRRLRKTLDDLVAEISERKQVEQALSKSEESYRSLVNNVPIGIYRTTLGGKILAANPALRQMFGMGGGTDLETVDTKLLYYNPQDRSIFVENLTRDDQGSTVEIPLRRIDGELFWGSISSRAVFGPDGQVDYFDGTIKDITERILAGAELDKNLKEKEVLLKELYHRTKNNMQVIISLLVLQSSYSEDPQVREILKTMESRVRSMAMVHEKLYKSKSLASIQMREYIQDLVMHLLASYRLSTGDIRPVIEVDEINFAIDTAIPCGLILNELVSNALKYSYPDGRHGVISVSMRRLDGEIQLRVSDDGVGVPENFDFHRDGKMGLQTVNAIGGHQLRGKVTFSSSPGFTCQILFKEPGEVPD